LGLVAKKGDGATRKPNVIQKNVSKWKRGGGKVGLGHEKCGGNFTCHSQNTYCEKKKKPGGDHISTKKEKEAQKKIGKRSLLVTSTRVLLCAGGNNGR